MGAINFKLPPFPPPFRKIYRKHISKSKKKYNEGNSELWFFGLFIYTILQNKGMRRCGVALPPIIFKRLKLPQQIIYRRKDNLSESQNHFKYRKNILISRFYEHFSRSSQNLGHFWKFEKISNS